LKTYLGDGVYAEIGHGELILTTENGISVTNRIVLEPEVVVNLLTVLKVQEHRKIGGYDR
jgi:hypothetical protein